MSTIYPTIESMPEQQVNTAFVHNDPFEDSMDVLIQPDSLESDVDFGILGNGAVYTYREKDTDVLTGLSITRATSVIESAKSNRFHVLRDLLPEETIIDLDAVHQTHRVGYAIVRHSLTP